MLTNLVKLVLYAELEATKFSAEKDSVQHQYTRDTTPQYFNRLGGKS